MWLPFPQRHMIRDHDFSDDSEFCTLCGAKRILLSFEAGEGHGSTVNVFSGAGMQKMPEDLTFYAHFRNADNWIPAGFAIAGEDQTVIYRPGAELEVTEDTVFVAVYADPYQLWVGSTKVTPDNQDDVLGDGKVSYDPYTYTLHLDDPGPIPGVTRGNLIYGVDLPLTVTGTANFSEDTGNFSEYIYVMNGSVTLDGEFICTGSTHFGIAGNGITIRGGSLLVDSPDYGLYSFGAIRIENEVERVQIDVGTNRAIYIPYPEYGGVILGDHLYVKECVKEDGEPGDDILDARHVVIEHGIPVKINGVSGSFNDKIKLNYYFDIPELLLRDNGAYVTLTNERTGEENTLYINEAEYVTDKGYRFSIPLAAKEAGDIITARAFDSDGNALMIRGNAKGIDYTETGVQYNLMDYFTWLESNGNESEKSVGKAAKDYCLAAQIYFDYYAEGLSVSSAVDDVSEEMLSGYIAGREGKLPTGVSIRGVTAMLESDNTFRLYLKFSKVDPTDFTYTIDGKEAELNKRADGAYYLALDEGVWSNHLQDTHTYSVSDGTDTYTITASVLTYARSCAIKNIKEESDLGKALYLYNQAAVSAFQ